MQGKCITFLEKFLQYIGKKSSESKKHSIKNNKLVITGTIEPVKYESQQGLRRETWSVQLKCEKNCNNNSRFSYQITKNLLQLYLVLWGQCTLSIRNKTRNDKKA